MADKVGAVVCMDNDYYRDKILNMLSGDEYYKETGCRANNHKRKSIKELIDQHGDGSHDDEQDYLTNFDHITSNFYGLPKVHKSKLISTAIAQQNSEYIGIRRPEDLKFRPIVGGPNSSTHRLSHFLDILLKPLCKEVSSFVRDDINFLNHLPSEVKPNSKLVTFDVVSLYTNIPHDLGITAVNFWLDKSTNVVDSHFNRDFIVKSLGIILKRNVFNFDGTHYLQKKGTNMGTKVAPTLATVVLFFLKKKQCINALERNTDKSFQHS